jgi:poly(ADP-ribose) glycohydrolase
MTNITIEESKKIEDYEGASSIMTDFANKYIGGGAARKGNVQEEILFAIYPELFVSQLFLERMDDHEAIYMKGAKRYSSYLGYGGSLKFKALDQSKKPAILDS